MKIVYKTGNLLDAQTDVIAHQVNCQGVMGSGVAKQIKEKWPNVFKSYKEFFKNVKDLCTLLGEAQFVESDNKYIVNLFAQFNYGTFPMRYTDYEALYNSLTNLRILMQYYNCKSVAFPYKMSSDRGGADWNIVLAMIESVFKNTDITIEIWSLNGYTGCN